ncbi:Transcriptional regulator of nonfermentable carbon utilization [Coemansia asiatica]|nr:Transcriptional regulator of nonfermentable carbon utilization [Coemansia asiatica]
MLSPVSGPMKTFGSQNQNQSLALPPLAIAHKRSNNNNNNDDYEDGNSSSAGSSARAKSSVNAKGKKRKANRACNHCQKSHLTCDDSRPCARCLKRGIASTCVDGVRKKAKYLLGIDECASQQNSADAQEPSAAAVTDPADASTGIVSDAGEPCQPNTQGKPKPL